MRNIKLLLQYDGSDYRGWQIQPNAVSIQGVLQERIRELTGEDATVIGSGRTDAGVHALGQVASFKTSSGLSPDIIRNALNAGLPDDIRVMDASDEAEGFHPRYDAKGKTYFYLISNSRVLSPFVFRYAWKIPQKLDPDSMSRSAEYLKGRHDFSAFRASGCSAKNPFRTICRISVERLASLELLTAKLPGDFLKISIEADAFLRHMVRNIVGTIVETGKGKMTPEDVRGILLSKDRRLAGATAPARGLFLERVDYRPT